MSLPNNKTLIKETSFPKLILPVYYLCSAFLMYIPTLLILLLMVIPLQHNFTISWLVLLPILIFQSLFNFGIGVLCAVASLYTRDLELFLPYFLRIWAYITPILFEKSSVYKLSESTGIIHLASLIILYNPLTPMIGSWSDIIIYGNTEHLSSSLLSMAIVSTTIAVFAYYLFYKREEEIFYRI
jgi:ABC-type polysaccharide/polyol phosphate export permease